MFDRKEPLKDRHDLETYIYWEVGTLTMIEVNQLVDLVLSTIRESPDANTLDVSSSYDG